MQFLVSCPLLPLFKSMRQLTERGRVEIIDLYRYGFSTREVAFMVGVCGSSVGLICKGMRKIGWSMSIFGRACAYCGTTEKELTMDHVVPLSAGGDHTLGNIVPACLSCNVRKSNRTDILPMICPAPCDS